MREFEYGAFRISTANDLTSFHKSSIDDSWSEKHKGHLAHMFTKRRMFRELLDGWQLASGLAGFVLLEAHGNCVDGQWVYYEDDRVVGTMQDWVDKMDGTAVALMITSCNPMGSEVTSQQSLVMHTGRIVESFPAMVHTPGLIRLYVPREGYIERNYKRLRRVINSLDMRPNLN